MTNRQRIRTSGGGFANALLNAVEDPGCVSKIVCAFYLADTKNQAALELLFPGLHHIAELVWNSWPKDFAPAIAIGFPNMRPEYLDAEEMR